MYVSDYTKDVEFLFTLTKKGKTPQSAIAKVISLDTGKIIIEHTIPSILELVLRD